MRARREVGAPVRKEVSGARRKDLLMGVGTRTTMAAAGLMLAATTGAAADSPTPYTICAHVPITGAAPIPHHEDRFGQFYFDYVNVELGGVDGHPVEFPAYDDEFNPAGARRAIERCLDAGARMLVGWYGPDQAESVSRWAEDHQMPYLRTSGPFAGSQDRKWSAFIGPPDEEQMVALASAILNGVERIPTIGMVRISSPYYDPGRDAFVDALAERGLTLAVDVPVQKDESNFQNVWFEIGQAEVDVVNLYVTPHIFAKMMAQRPATVDASFVSIATMIGTNVAGASARGSRVQTFHDPSPVYDPADSTLLWHDEIVEFQRIFRTYSPEQTPPADDLDWLAYLRAKQVHRFLDALDEDLGAEHIRSMFSTYAEDPGAAFPTCALDFSATPLLGSHAWHVFELDDGRWRQAASCADAVTTDLTPPLIACSDAPVALAPVRCSFQDPGSGVGAYAITDLGVPAPGAPVGGDGGCAPATEAMITLPPGFHRLVITATSCGGVSRAVTATYLSADV